MIALLNTALMIMTKKGSSYILADENLKCDSLMVGYSSLDHGKLYELSQSNLDVS